MTSTRSKQYTDVKLPERYVIFAMHNINNNNISYNIYGKNLRTYVHKYNTVYNVNDVCCCYARRLYNRSSLSTDDDHPYYYDIYCNL